MHREGQAGHSLAVGHGAAGDLGDLDLQAGHHHGQIQHQAVAILAVNLQGGGKVLPGDGVGPGGAHPAVGLALDEGGAGVGAVAAVDGHAVALGDKADDGVAGDGGTAAGELQKARADVLHDDAGVGGHSGLLPVGLEGLGRLILGGGGLAGLHQLVADAVDALHRRHAAVADGGVHVVQGVEAHLAQDGGQHVLVLQHSRVDAHALELGFEAGLAVGDVLLALFLLEPLLDLDARLVALADLEPVAAGTLGALGGEYLHDVAVFELHVEAGNAVIHLGAHHGVAHGGVDGIGEVDGRGAGGQGDDLALGGEDEDLVVEHIHLEGVDVVLGLGVLLAL